MRWWFHVRRYRASAIAVVCAVVVAAPQLNAQSVAGEAQSVAEEAQSVAEDAQSVAERIAAVLILVYPDHIAGFDSGSQELVWHDGSRLALGTVPEPYKTLPALSEHAYEERLNHADLFDSFQVPYSAGEPVLRRPPRNIDPGRMRDDTFFGRMYGADRAAVERHLVPVVWLPGVADVRLMVTAVNGVAERLERVSRRLVALPHLHRYVDRPIGTYAWRTIAGTDRPSMHSYGIAVDINETAGRYWRWDLSAGRRPPTRPALPLELVAVFEAEGFVWGGRWYHYDEFHFEYRPELIAWAALRAEAGAGR